MITFWVLNLSVTVENEVSYAQQANYKREKQNRAGYCHRPYRSGWDDYRGDICQSCSYCAHSKDPNFTDNHTCERCSPAFTGYFHIIPFFNNPNDSGRGAATIRDFDPGLHRGQRE